MEILSPNKPLREPLLERNTNSSILLPYRVKPFGQNPIYTDWIELVQDIQVKHNAIVTDTKKIIVSGYHLVLDSSEDPDVSLYSKIAGTPGDERKDLSTLIINADTIEVAGRVRLPQTSLVIHARELIFNDKEAFYTLIDTTPYGFELPAEDYVIDNKPAQDGGNGMPGADLILAVKKATYNDIENQPRISMSGGPGQKPGNGREGKSGRSIPPIKCSGFPYAFDACKAIKSKGINHKKVVYIVNPKIPNSGYGLNQFPGNGRPAKPSGKPGLGGAGGHAQVAKSELMELIATPGGESGAEGPGFSGGPGGTPRPAYTIAHNGPGILGIFKQHKSKKGLDADPVQPDSLFGPEGKKILDEQIGYLNSANVERILDFARDMYRANYREDTDDILDNLYQAIENHASKDWAYTREAPLHAETSVLTIEALKSKLDRGLDFYGNPLGWVPALSLEILLKVYDSEIRNVVKLLFLYHQLKTRNLKRDNYLEGLNRASELLIRDIAKLRDRYEMLKEQVSRLEAQLRSLGYKIEAFSELIEQEEERLIAAARNQIEERQNELDGLKGIVKIVGSITVGASAMSNVGFGLVISEIINNLNFLDQKPKWDRTEQAAESIGIIIDKLGEARDTYDHLNDIPAYAEEVKRLFEKLKSESNYYQELLEKLSETVVDSQEIGIELDNVLQELRTIGKEVSQRLTQTSVIRKQKLPVYRFSGVDVQAILQRLVQEAKQRLEEFQYQLVLAFEYEFLRPYKASISIHRTVEEMASILQRSPEGELIELDSEDADKLQTIFSQEMHEIFARGLDILTHEGGRQRSKLEYLFTDTDFDQLDESLYFTFNPRERGLLFEGEQDLRLRGLKIRDLDVDLDDNSGYGTLKIIIEHSGISFIESGEDIYRFNYGRNNSSPFRWEFTYSLSEFDQSDGNIYSLSENSLLSAFLTVAGSDQMSLENLRQFTFPGLIADYKIEVRQTGSVSAKISRLLIEIDYEYRDIDL